MFPPYTPAFRVVAPPPPPPHRPSCSQQQQQQQPPPPPPSPQRFMVPNASKLSKVTKSAFAGLFFDKIQHPKNYVFLFDLSKAVHATDTQVQIEDNQKLVLRVRQENPKYGGIIEHVETYALDEDCQVCQTGNTESVTAWTQEDVLLVRVPRISADTL